MKCTSKYLYLTLIITILTLSSCMFAQNYPVKIALPLSTSTVISEVTTAPKIAPTVFVSVYNYVTNPNYKKECLEINSSFTDSQAGFQGIYPGITYAKEVKSIFGEPVRVIDGGDGLYWYYDNNPSNMFTITIVGDSVDKVGVSNYDLTSPSLKKIIEEYGCPGMIQVIDTSEEVSGNYNMAVFCYPENGVEFWFDFNNITLSSVPVDIAYFKPIALNDYIQSINRFSENLSVGNAFMAPIYWSEVVK